MFSEKIKSKIEELLSLKLKKNFGINTVSAVAGGCINSCYKLKSSSVNYFLKLNSKSRFPKMFEAEAKGLDLLRAEKNIKIPEVILYDDIDDVSLLVLEFIESAPQKPRFFEDFAIQLASLHKRTSSQFGLDHNNYIGSLQQSNQKHNSWTDFFINERLLKQISLAQSHHAIDKAAVEEFEKLFKKMKEIFPEEKPALLHGDLWSGNFLSSERGNVCLIDPAVYFGHREMDIAMTKLFGGFPSSFYQAYQSAFPMQKNWEQRLDICNLYPLMVHVNIFGGSYIQQVKSILKRYN